MSTTNKFLIDKVDIKLSEEQKNGIREKVARMFKHNTDDNLPAINLVEFIDIQAFIDPKYLIKSWSFIFFKEVMPHIDENYEEHDFLTIPILIDGGPFYFGDTHLKKEFKLNVGDVFRVRTMHYHWVNTPDINLKDNTNFCVTLQYAIEKTKFNKISQEILAQIK